MRSTPISRHPLLSSSKCARRVTSRPSVTAARRSARCRHAIGAGSHPQRGAAARASLHRCRHSYRSRCANFARARLARRTWGRGSIRSRPSRSGGSSARAAVECAYESEIAPGHLSLELSSEGLLPFEDDDDECEPAEPGAAPVVIDVAPGATTANNDVATVAAEPGNVIKSARERRAAEAQHNEYEDLSSRSGLLRDYMMTHVMPVVTQGLLECLKTRPEDATDFMADYLTVEAKKRVRAHEARHFLAFQASAAKLKELQDEEDRLAELEDAED